MDAAPSHAWQVMHPPLQPHGQGWLDVGDGHRLHWQSCGHPAAPAALFVHGGPGAGCRADDRRWFDPRDWRIVLFDQRGCGRSQPLGQVHANDTAHAVGDIERLRVHLGIDRWLVFGGSWGATLALAYAQRHPARVTGLVLRGVFTASAAESRWLYGGGSGGAGAAGLRPAAWRRFTAALPAGRAACARDLLDAYAEQLDGGDAVAPRAAAAWLGWEDELMGAPPAPLHAPPPAAAGAPESAAPATGAAAAAAAAATSASVATARLAVHFARQHWFLREGELLAGAHRLRGIPGVIVQGAEDLVTPPAGAAALHAAWPTSRHVVVAGAGHATDHPRLAQALVDATAALARPPLPAQSTGDRR